MQKSEKIIIKIILMGIVFNNLCISSLFGQGPHIVRGEVTYPGGGSPPETALTFSAYITDRPGDVLTETSYNCGYTLIEGLGWYYVQCSNFASGWSPGETFHIAMDDGYDGTATDEIVLTTQVEDTLDLIILGSSLSVELLSFTAYKGKEEIILKWITASEVNNLGFNLYRSVGENNSYTCITNELIKSAGNTSTQQSYNHIDRNVFNGNTYWYRLEDLDIFGNSSNLGVISLTLSDTDLSEFKLHDSFPNPFNCRAVIKYYVSSFGYLTLVIYDIKGQMIRKLFEGNQPAGLHEAVWEGNDESGKIVASGEYLGVLTGNGNKNVMKLIFIK